MAKVEIDFSPRFVRLQWGRRARPQCLQPRQYGGNNLEGVYCVEPQASGQGVQTHHEHKFGSKSF
jgi:hypothetical protein